MKKLSFIFAFLITALSGFGQLSELTFIHDGEDRSYFLYLPDNIAPGSPLVFVLHGYTSTAAGIIDNYGMNDIADANGFAVCYPQGTQDLSGTEFWNIEFPLESVDDVGFLSNLAGDLQTVYDLDENCTYVCGMSNGGMMSYYLGCERPDVFKAFASVTGTVTTNFISNCQGNIPVPFLEIHGTSDLVVPYNGGDIAAATFGNFFPVEQIFRTWNNINDCQSVSTFSIPNAPVTDFSSVQGAEVSDCDGGLKARFYRVDGGGHTWPGAPPVPFLDFLQPTNQDISASAEIWNFFSLLCSPSGLVAQENNVQDEKASLFPNPSYGDLNIDFTGANRAEITVISVEGRVVYQGQLNEGRNHLSLYHLDKGFYLAQIRGEKEHVIKFILE
ncbi:T9SS type A sorting domain-containing protein [Cryomorphaceae bacterium 1068]|nr:T9SS type A sorting domain-containing protein [Cryomorphaceae bacterium 1068]